MVFHLSIVITTKRAMLMSTESVKSLRMAIGEKFGSGALGRSFLSLSKNDVWSLNAFFMGLRTGFNLLVLLLNR